MNNKPRIAFYLQDQVEILDFAGPMEVFAYAGYEIFTVSKTKDPIKAQGIVTVLADYSIADAPAADILAFFGGNAGLAENDPEVIQWIINHKEVSYHFSVCSGAFILAKAGLLANQHATTFHSAIDRFEKKYPTTAVHRGARFVDNGKIITTAGVSAGIDGALHLVAKLNGFNAARAAAHYIEYDKWDPTLGLNLSDHDPYEGMLDVVFFVEYLGEYVTSDGGAISLIIDEHEQSLSAIIQDQRQPFLYLNRDQFETTEGAAIAFIRNEDQEVTGFKLMKEETAIFERLPTIT
jgi:putative intracellular protease/amidase